MEKFFNLLQKNPKYDPNLSWDSMIKSWEENFLGSNAHNENFSNPLESDYSFSNPVDVNTNDHKSISAMFFDNTLHPHNSDKFTCINNNCMEAMNVKNGGKKISEKNTWIIQRSYDYVSKPFFRLVLKPNLSEPDIKNLLYLLADCDFSIIMGGSEVFRLPKLLFVYLVCEKLSNPIRVFDVKEFLESNSMEDIRKKIFKFTDKACWINQKYYVKNPTDKYIDIPLLVDFFSYNFSTALVAMQFHDVRYNLTIQKNKVAGISKYLEDIVLMFEEVVIADSPYRKELAQNSHEFLKMKPEMEYFHCWKGNIMELSDKLYFASKFIFVVVRQHEMTDMDLEIINQTNVDVDISQFPQITEVELEEKYNLGQGSTCKKKSSIQLDNIWVAQFDDLIIYGIASDGISNMKNWIRVQSECIDSIEKMSFGSNENGQIAGSNINPNNYNSIFGIVNLTGIKIYWSETSIQTNVEIFVVKQNIQRVMSGMTGDAYSN
jgi:hypothetical protein